VFLPLFVFALAPRMPRRPSTTTAAPAAAEAADAPTEGARPVVVYRALTAFWLFSNSKREEAKAAGDRALEVPEVMSMWRALSRDEKQVWEERERVEQKRYFNEVRARALWDEAHGRGDEGEDGGEEDEEEKDEEEEEEEEEEGGEGGKLKRELRELARYKFPYQRVLKLMKLQDEVGNVNKLAGVVMNKALEGFVERCVLEAASFTARKGRKTIFLKDFLGSMKAHANPESMQHFVEEFQLPPPPPPTKAKPKKRAPAKKKDAKPDFKDAVPPEAPASAPRMPPKKRGADAAAEGTDAVPPKKRGRPAAAPAAAAPAAAEPEAEPAASAAAAAEPPSTKRARRG